MSRVNDSVSLPETANERVEHNKSSVDYNLSASGGRLEFMWQAGRYQLMRNGIRTSLIGLVSFCIKECVSSFFMCCRLQMPAVREGTPRMGVSSLCQRGSGFSLFDLCLSRKFLLRNPHFSVIDLSSVGFMTKLRYREAIITSIILIRFLSEDIWKLRDRDQFALYTRYTIG